MDFKGTRGNIGMSPLKFNIATEPALGTQIKGIHNKFGSISSRQSNAQNQTSRISYFQQKVQNGQEKIISLQSELREYQNRTTKNEISQMELDALKSLVHQKQSELRKIMADVEYYKKEIISFRNRMQCA